MEGSFDVSSLAEGLSGLSSHAAPNPSASREYHAASALRETPYASLGPLLSHLSEVVDDIIHADSESSCPERAIEKVQSLCFAVSSAVGSSRLRGHDEGQLWEASMALWVRILEPQAKFHCS